MRAGNGFLVAWLIWLGLFLVIELVALRAPERTFTLSAYINRLPIALVVGVWLWLGWHLIVRR